MTQNKTEILEMLKALSNESRLSIMCWLKDPHESFKDLEKHSDEGIPGWGGACVGTIQEKSGLSQSTTSSYLSILQKASLIQSKRYEKWTYYRRNEEALAKLQTFIEMQI